jgi:hypothetical protein
MIARLALFVGAVWGAVWISDLYDRWIKREDKK